MSSNLQTQMGQTPSIWGMRTQQQSGIATSPQSIEQTVAWENNQPSKKKFLTRNQANNILKQWETMGRTRWEVMYDLINRWYEVEWFVNAQKKHLMDSWAKQREKIDEFKQWFFEERQKEMDAPKTAFGKYVLEPWGLPEPDISLWDIWKWAMNQIWALKTWFEGAWERLTERTADIRESMDKVESWEISKLRWLYRNLWNIAMMPIDIWEEIIGEQFTQLNKNTWWFLGEVFQGAGADLVEDIQSTDQWSKWIEILSGKIKDYKNWADENPENAKDVWLGLWLLEYVPIQKLGWRIIKQIPDINTIAKSVDNVYDGISKTNSAVNTAVQEARQAINNANIPSFEKDFLNREITWIGKSIEKTAADRVSEALNPTKQDMKAITDKIADDFVQRWLIWSRESLYKRSENEIKKRWSRIEEFIQDKWLQWNIQSSDLWKFVDELIDWVVTPWKEGATVVLDPQQYKELISMKDMIWQLDDSIPMDQARQIRQVLDWVVERWKWFGVEDATKVKTNLNKKFTDLIRSEIAKQNPDLAWLNKEYSFWKNLNTVLDETIQRKRPQSWWLRRAVWALSAGMQQWWILNQIWSYILTKWFLDLTSSATWKTLSAQIRRRVATISKFMRYRLSE